MFEQILTKEILHQLYVEQGQSSAAIARKFGASVVTVQHYMKRYGIPFRDNPNRPRDISGQRFGRLTAVRVSSPDRHGKSRWHCTCKCGKSVVVNYSSLVRGLSKSCGCHKTELCRKGGYKDISRSWWRRIIQNAVLRGYKFDLTPEDVWAAYEQQNGKCALTNLSIQFFPDYNRVHLQTASLDRIDSSLGYVKGNIQIVHQVVNPMKSYLTDEEFVAFCNEVARTRPMEHDACLVATSRTVLRKQS
jgi:hypothetical protein